jgi:hypothetical protein
MVDLQICNALCCCAGFVKLLLRHAEHAKLVNKSTSILTVTFWHDVTTPSIVLCISDEAFHNLVCLCWIKQSTRVRTMVDLKIVKQTRKHDPVTGIDMRCRFNGMKGTILRCQSQQQMLNAVASAVALAMVVVGGPEEGCGLFWNPVHFAACAFFLPRPVPPKRHAMMQAKQELLEGFESKSNACDRAWLLKETQGITRRFEGTRNIFMLLNNPWATFHS